MVGTITRPNVPFDYKNPEHTGYLGDKFGQFEARKERMQEFDRHLGISFAISAFAFSAYSLWLMPSICVLAACYCSYLLAQRPTVFDGYHTILMDLKADYAWVFPENDSLYYRLRDPLVQRLARVLSPLLAQDSVIKWRTQDITPSISEPGKYWNHEELPEDFKAFLRQLKRGEESNGWTTKLYGEKAVGNFSPLLKEWLQRNITNVMPQPVRGMIEGHTEVQHFNSGHRI